MADAVLRNRSRTGASPGASCRGAPARGHTGLQLYIFSVGLAVASRATTRRQIVSLTNDLLGHGHRRARGLDAGLDAVRRRPRRSARSGRPEAKKASSVQGHRRARAGSDRRESRRVVQGSACERTHRFAAIHFFGRARGRVSCNDTTSNRELDQRLARAGPSEGTRV